ALIFKWLWRFLSHDNSLWFRVIFALHGYNLMAFSTSYSLIWSTIIKEVNSLKAQGVDLLSHCKVRVGNGLRTSFWNDPWIGDTLLKHLFSRLYALEVSKQVSVAEKFNVSVTGSFRRDVRGGEESHQLNLLTNLLDTVILSNMEDKWFLNLNGDGRLSVKDVRCLLDDVFLPKAEVPTRWIKSISIKINIFAWKLCLDRLPTRVNLAKKNVAVASLLCPLCDSGMEDAAHLFFRCDMTKDVMFLVSHWWDLEDRRFGSFQE
nr:hypothetical protein [Tanacetum cinerariifolium]